MLSTILIVLLILLLFGEASVRRPSGGSFSRGQQGQGDAQAPCFALNARHT
jgi:hypothetical protein